MADGREADSLRPAVHTRIMGLSLGVIGVPTLVEDVHGAVASYL